MTDYIFVAIYEEQVGLFAAPTIEEANQMAYEGLDYMMDDNLDPERFFTRPATIEDIQNIIAAGGFCPDGEVLIYPCRYVAIKTDALAISGQSSKQDTG